MSIVAQLGPKTLRFVAEQRVWLIWQCARDDDDDDCVGRDTPVSCN